MEDNELRHYLRAVRRRWRLVLAVFVGIAGTALVVSSAQAPQYRAEAQLLLSDTPSEALVADQGAGYRSSADAARILNNQLSFVEGEAVRAAAKEAYDGPLDVGAVSASAVSAEADIIELSATSTDPVDVTELVNAYADAYVDVHRRQRVDDLLQAGSDLQLQVDELDAQIAAARAAGLDTGALESQRMFYRGQLDQLHVGARLAESGGIEVLSRAEEPSAPVSPRVARSLLLGACAGVVLGIGLALLRDRFDDSVSSKDDCEATAGRPALGLIPRSPRRYRQADIVALRSPGSPATEAYRTLRTSIRFLRIDRPARVLQVTSAAASEGKTTVAANLGAVFAQAGERTIVIGADLRRPRIDHVFDVGPSPGLTGALSGTASLADVTFAVEAEAGLHLLPSGPPPPNPTGILESARLRELLAVLRAWYDVVILDCPPLLPVTDALLLAEHADMTLLVVANRSSSRRDVARAVELLEQAKAPLAGTVLTRVAGDAAYEQAYYGYSERQGRRRDRVATQLASTLASALASAVRRPQSGELPVAPGGDERAPAAALFGLHDDAYAVAGDGRGLHGAGDRDR